MSPKKKRGPHALGAYAGFSAQPTRMALLLLQASPGAKVSLEHYDDVGVESPSGDVLASQMKMAKSKNPVADRSVELWKTFANWVRQVRSKELDPTITTFEIYVRREFSGSWVRKFDAAQTKQAADEVCTAAKARLWDAGTLSADDPLHPHIQELFATQTGQRCLERIVQRFQFVQSTAGSPAEEVEAHVREKLLVHPSEVGQIVQQVHGWLKVEIDKQIENAGRAPVIDRDTFWRELLTYHRSLSTGASLPDLGERPKDHDYVQMLALPFVEQLGLIQATTGDVRYAMTCYFRSASTRTKWGDFDLIHQDSIADLEEALLQAHRDYQQLAGPAAQMTEETLGRQILAHCNRHRTQVEGKTPPDYFIPGCFHRLANCRSIGWHPRYLELMQRVA